jgi:hypothetical protein
MHWKLKYKSRGKVEMQISEQKEEKEKRIKKMLKRNWNCTNASQLLGRKFAKILT